jgi:outer membrane lipoprotein-sorting protein
MLAPCKFLAMAANCPIRFAFAAALLLVAAANGGCSKPTSTPADAKTASVESAQHAAHDHERQHDHADEAEHAHETDQSVERAIEITTRMLAAYRSAKSYADHGAYVEEAVYRGEGVAHQIPYYEMSVALERPNRLRVTLAESVADDSGQRHSFAIASDGEFLRATLSDIDDQMVEFPAPVKITPANVLADPMIAAKLRGRLLGDLFPQLAMLLNDSDEDEAAIFPRDSHPRLLPTTPLDGRVCHRVATSHPEGTRVLWIDAETSMLRRMELPIEAELARIDPEHRYLRLSVRIEFQDPTFDAQIAPAAFALEPPTGARRVRRFVEPSDSEQEGTAKDAKSGREEGEETGEVE